MEKTGVREIKGKIAGELEQIGRYVGGFAPQSAKDEQALADILSMVSGVNAEIGKIEEAHQRRLHLTRELAKALSEMEKDASQFAERHGKNPAD